MTRPQPIPEGYGAVTPWVVTKDTRRLLEFIKQAFDAEELAGSRWRAAPSGTPRRGSVTRSS